MLLHTVCSSSSFVFLHCCSFFLCRYVVVLSSFAAVVPWAIFVAFKEDTAFWYGYAYDFVATKHQQHRSGRKKGPENQPASTKEVGAGDIRRPLLGLTLPENALVDINEGIEELERSDIISFAELSIDIFSLLGAGGVSKVFQGKCRGQPAAFKLIFAPTITKETIQGFFKEASLLRRCAASPNVVNILGVCIAPPSLAHVLELCDGTLHDALEEKRIQEHGGSGGGGNRSISSSSSNGGPDMYYFAQCAVQCARAVAFLHSRRILHRDLKSLNFLVTRSSGGSGGGDSGEMIIKLADMDQAVELTDATATCYMEESEVIVGTPRKFEPIISKQHKDLGH